MSKFDREDEEECPGKEECDDDYCEDRQTYYIEVTRTVKFTIRAHDEDEALNVAYDVDLVAEQPSSGLVDDWDDGGVEWDIESESDARRREAEGRRIMAQIEAEMAAEATT